MCSIMPSSNSESFTSFLNLIPFISVSSLIMACCCSVAQSCSTLWDPMDCSEPGFLLLHCLLEFAHSHVHWVFDAIKPSHPLLLLLFPSLIVVVRISKIILNNSGACQCRRLRFNPWIGKIPGRRKWQPTPVFLPGESHGWRSLAGYSLGGHRESDRTEWLINSDDSGHSCLIPDLRGNAFSFSPLRIKFAVDLSYMPLLCWGRSLSGEFLS